MKSCESYEIHISALIDGETNRADTLAILDHMPGCASCQRFYRDCRQLQDVADEMPLSIDVQRESESASLLPVITRLPHRTHFVWAAAAGIALLFVAAGMWLRPAVSTSVDSNSHVIDLSVQKPSVPMDDSQFMEISVALLHAEPRYQRSMIEILERFERGRGLDESSVDVAAMGAESEEPWTRDEFDDAEAGDGRRTRPQQ